MRRVSFVALLAVLTGAALVGGQGTAQTSGPAPAQATGQSPSFRAATHSVSLYVTVFDNGGRLIPNLTKDDFEVYDDGKLQNLSLFTNDIQPFSVVMMLDRSGSMVSNFDLERDGAEVFVSNLLKDDKARIGSFSNRIEIDPDTFTSDKDTLIRILHEDLQEPGITPLWNATSAAMNSVAHQNGRRVVLLFTDGFDNPERPGFSMTFTDVHERSRTDEIMVYAIGLADSCGKLDPPLGDPGGARFQGRAGPPVGGVDRAVPKPGGIPKPGNPLIPGSTPLGPSINIPLDKLLGKHNSDRPCSGGKPDPNLKDLAADGGGGYYELRNADDLSATFARIADELHHQYLLAFNATKLDGKTHALEVRIRQPNLTIRARRSYVATPDK
jgi:VWFA-related protein